MFPLRKVVEGLLGGPSSFVRCPLYVLYEEYSKTSLELGESIFIG